MTLIKFSLFAGFALLLSAFSYAECYASINRVIESNGIVMQQTCPDGQEWSDTDGACIPEKPRGSH